jgi:hypothetical protein
VPWNLVFNDGPDSYTVITEVEAFPTGVQFSIRTRSRPGTQDWNPRDRMRSLHDPDGPRFGVGFADGRKAFSTAWLPQLPNQNPTGPVLRTLGGGGGGREWRQGYWLWPLPPRGPLTFVSAWPARGSAENVVTADASDLVVAAANARQLWEIDDQTVGSGSGMGVQWSGTSVTRTAHRSPSPPFADEASGD